MNRAMTTLRTTGARILVAGLLALAASACSARSERWEAQIEAWPEDLPTGGTPTEYREYHEGEEAFEAMMEAENALAEPH